MRNKVPARGDTRTEAVLSRAESVLAGGAQGLRPTSGIWPGRSVGGRRLLFGTCAAWCVSHNRRTSLRSGSHTGCVTDVMDLCGLLLMEQSDPAWLMSRRMRECPLCCGISQLKSILASPQKDFSLLLMPPLKSLATFFTSYIMHFLVYFFPGGLWCGLFHLWYSNPSSSVWSIC